jgi:hypothetical protein
MNIFWSINTLSQLRVSFTLRYNEENLSVFSCLDRDMMCKDAEWYWFVTPEETALFESGKVQVLACPVSLNILG